MPQKKDQSGKTISKEAEAAARANREKLFKVESTGMFQPPQSLTQVIVSLGLALGIKKGKIPKDVIKSFDALRDEMLNATAPRES